MGKSVIFCADEMIVGRYYKIITMPIGFSTVYDGKETELPYNYWAKYTCDSDNIILAHDTVYIKATGAFTIRSTDCTGSICEKTILAIDEPTIERNTVEVAPSNWEELKSLVTAECTLYSVAMGEYHFDITDEAFVLPYGTIVDFNDSTIYVTSSYKGTSAYAHDYYKMFWFENDHSGLKNANFIGNMYGDTSYLEWCTTVQVNGGYNIHIENITFKDLVGFNFSVGGGATANTKCYTPAKTYTGCWKPNIQGNYNGYVNDEGSLVFDIGSWSNNELIPILKSTDGSYAVGHSILWMYSVSKVYDIAFYDNERNFIEVRRYQQHYKKYYYPDNAEYIRLTVYQTKEPENINPNDDICFLRMLGSWETDFRYRPTEELFVSNIKYIGGVSSSSVNIVGACRDCHFEMIDCPYNGWYGANYAASFDIEDGFNAMLGVVISHSRLALLRVNGVQGFSFVSGKLESVGFSNSVYFPTFLNSVSAHPLGAYLTVTGCKDVFGVITEIDSYIFNIIEGVVLGEGDYYNVYSFTKLTRDDSIAINDKISIWYNKLHLAKETNGRSK